jgi:hypothetical protein
MQHAFHKSSLTNISVLFCQEGILAWKKRNAHFTHIVLTIIFAMQRLLVSTAEEGAMKFHFC